MPRRASGWTIGRVLSYAMGHVLNDMCASTWFSYLLIFLHKAVGLSPSQAATVMFSGQLADGLATPLVGIFSDYSSGCPTWGLGRRTGWLAGGAMLVVVCYYMVFGFCWLRWLTPYPSPIALVVYYSFAAALFNIGWATVQVSHMSLVPELSTSDAVRCKLNSYRYGFTILSNVVVFCAFYVLLQHIQPYEVPDAHKFSLLADFILVVGVLSVFGFLYGTKEDIYEEVKRTRSSAAEAQLKHKGPNDLLFSEAGISQTTAVKPDDDHQRRIYWHEWFSKRMFYQVGVIYMCTRLVVNITQVYLPFYLIASLKMSATSIALVPLVVYLAGFITAFFTQKLDSLIGRNNAYTIGGTLNLATLTALYFLGQDVRSWVYLFAVFLGFGNSIIMVTSVCMEGDLVGVHDGGSAFVYGAMSFTDKLSNGIVIIVIQHYHEHIQNQYEANGKEDCHFSRLAFCLVPIASMMMGIITVKTMSICHRPGAAAAAAADSSSTYGAI